jgi:glucose-6-phosphate 1-epimerase
MIDAEPGDTAVTIDFGLSPSNLDEEARQAWPYSFGLIYSVRLSRDGLETSIVVRNEGQEAWDFQVLMHTYFRVQVGKGVQEMLAGKLTWKKDITKVKICGLGNSKYIDKTAGGAVAVDANSNITITSETDRVYTPANGPKHPILIYEGDKQIFEIVRDNLGDAVVWNPWTEKANGMSDFEPKDGFVNMICVEAGQVSNWVKVEAGETFEGSQMIKAAL